MEVADSKDEILIRYLLNELSKDDNEELEDEMTLDAELSDRAQVVEMKLIETYVLDQMNLAEKARFEKGFLLFPTNRDKVEDARAFHESLRRQSRLEVPSATPPGWFASLSQIQLSAKVAALLLLLITGVVVGILILVPGRPNENVSNTNDSTNIRPEVKTEDTRDAPPINSAHGSSNEEIAKLDDRARSTVVVRSISELRGVVKRSGDASSRGPDKGSQDKIIKPHLIRIPARSGFVTLNMSLMPHEYYKEGVDCSVDISDALFQRVFPKGEGNNQVVKARLHAGKFPYQVSFKIPTAYLKEGNLYYFRIAETDSVTPFKIKFTN